MLFQFYQDILVSTYSQKNATFHLTIPLFHLFLFSKIIKRNDMHGVLICPREQKRWFTGRVHVFQKSLSGSFLRLFNTPITREIWDSWVTPHSTQIWSAWKSVILVIINQCNATVQYFAILLACEQGKGRGGKGGRKENIACCQGNI